MTCLVQVDMGDAFVDAWSVANKVSDLLLERMGREVRRRTRGHAPIYF